MKTSNVHVPLALCLFCGIRQLSASGLGQQEGQYPTCYCQATDYHSRNSEVVDLQQIHHRR